MGDVPASNNDETAANADTQASVDRTKNQATRTRQQAESAAEKRPSFFRRIALFITQVVDEMKKVMYPSKEELWAYFLVVVVFVAAIMAYTGLLDVAFGKLNSIVFG